MGVRIRQLRPCPHGSCPLAFAFAESHKRLRDSAANVHFAALANSDFVRSAASSGRLGEQAFPQSRDRHHERRTSGGPVAALRRRACAASGPGVRRAVQTPARVGEGIPESARLGVVRAGAMKRVLMDTSGCYALLDGTDPVSHQQCLKSGLLKMPITGQRLGEAFVCHHYKRDAVGKAPVLVGPAQVDLETALHQSRTGRNEAQP